MNASAKLSDAILEVIPFDRFVDTADVVSSLSVYPEKAVRAAIVLLALDGAVTSDRPGTYDGRAMIRRLA